jgi:glycosyltransferase involved in cell wall biosynthesis
VPALRVLILGLNYAPEPTGIAPYTTGMAQGLARRGHRVRVITGYPHYPQWRIDDRYGGLRTRELDGIIEITRVRHPVPRNPSGFGRIGMEVAFAAHAFSVREPTPDVVLAVSPALLGVASALRRRRRGVTAVGVVVQDLYSRAISETGALSGRGSGFAGRLEGELLRRADGVVVIHDSFQASLESIGVDRERITVIRNWSHVERATADRMAVRRRLGWREDELVALHAGNMGAKQGLENLVTAARLAQRRGLPVRFVLLGDGSRRADLESQAAGCDRLSFVDPVGGSEFPEVLAAADVLLLNEKPGVKEMCVPSKLTSYFTAGRPVIAATDVGSASAGEMAAAGAGPIVLAGDPAALLDAVLDVTADDAAVTAIGGSADRYAREVLSAEAAEEAYAAWVERMAAGLGPWFSA